MERLENKEKTNVLLREDNKDEKRVAYVKMYKETALMIVKIEPEELYTIAFAKRIITEKTWKSIEETERWLEKPTEAGEFPWKEITVIGLITKEIQ